MVDEEDSTKIRMVEFLSESTPGKTPDEYEQHYQTIDDLLKRYQDPEDLLWLVSTLVDAKGKWGTYGRRNVAINAMAAALGVEGKPMRETTQADLYRMAIGVCRHAIVTIHELNKPEGERSKEGRAQRELDACERLAVELPRVHPQFSQLDKGKIRAKLRNVRANGEIELAAYVADAADLHWKIDNMRREYGREI